MGSISSWGQRLQMSTTDISPAFSSIRNLRVAETRPEHFDRALAEKAGMREDVYGTKRSELFIWGVVDQQVHKNVRLNQEAQVGYSAPGIVTINIEGVGDVSVYHGNLFLGRLRQNQLITRENDVLHSEFMARRLVPALEPAVISIARVLNMDQEFVSGFLIEEWATTVARICIGLRRLGTGGSLLITSTPSRNMLDVVHRFRYRRLGDATILKVLDDQYLSKIEQDNVDTSGMPNEHMFAEADAEDRAEELTGAVKIVTSLAAVDGLVLLDLKLGIVGFGVKIKASKKIGAVFDGADFARRGTKAKKIDVSQFGTRHGSMLRYCQADRNAIGVVISQDGHTRLIASVRRNLTLWDNVKLLGYEHDVIWTRSFPIAKEPTTLGQHLKKKRFGAGIRQSEAARILGVSTRSLSLWECDRLFPTTSHHARIIKYMGYDPFEKLMK